MVPTPGYRESRRRARRQVKVAAGAAIHDHCVRPGRRAGAETLSRTEGDALPLSLARGTIRCRRQAEYPPDTSLHGFPRFCTVRWVPGAANVETSQVGRVPAVAFSRKEPFAGRCDWAAPTTMARRCVRPTRARNLGESASVCATGCRKGVAVICIGVVDRYIFPHAPA